MPAVRLLGRDHEIMGALGGLPHRGGTLVVRSEAGIGKSALLSEASASAADSGMQVMSATGVQFETNLPSRAFTNCCVGR
jgi:predicted ATP-dependent serine protease